MQQQEGKRWAISFASQRLRNAERNDKNYSAKNLELLGLEWAVTKKFRGYLLGCKFTVITDNNLLSYLKTTRLGALELAFDFDV